MRRIRCPECRTVLELRYSNLMQGFHAQCPGCVWMGNIKDWDIDFKVDAVADELNRPFRARWEEAPVFKASELLAEPSVSRSVEERPKIQGGDV
jgi:hypothetical protein